MATNGFKFGYKRFNWKSGDLYIERKTDKKGRLEIFLPLKK
jgi:hypothetical protein